MRFVVNCTPDIVTEICAVTIFWDVTIRTDRTFKSNIPNIVKKDQKNRMCIFIDSAVLAYCNIN